MTKRVAINGFGRIGRQSLKALLERSPYLDVVAINDLVEPELDALLFKHDFDLRRLWRHGGAHLRSPRHRRSRDPGPA